MRSCFAIQQQEKTLVSDHCLNQDPSARRTDEYDFTILHCNVPDFKYVRFFCDVETTELMEKDTS